MSQNTHLPHNKTYIKKHIRRSKRLLWRYRHGSRWAAKALTGEMTAVKEALEEEVHGLHGIDPDDRDNLDPNAEHFIALLKSHLDEHWSGPKLLYRVGVVIGTVFLVAGLVFLGAALLRVFPMFAPAINKTLRWASQPPSMLTDLGAPLTVIGGGLTGGSVFAGGRT